MRRLSSRYVRLICALGVAVPTTLAVATPVHAALNIGTLTVNLTAYTGAPLPGATVGIYLGATPAGALTDLGGGTYSHLLTTGSYKIRVRAPGGLVQYVPGQTGISTATSYPVQVGQTTTVNEQLLPSGNVQVSVVDGGSNAPVTTGCLSLLAADSVVLTQPLCNVPDGTLRVAGVPLGTIQVGLDTTKTEWPGMRPITVTAGPGTYRVAFDPAAAVRTTVQAADDASVHPTACVHAVYPGVDESTNVSCAQADGSLLIGPLPAAPVQLFVDTSTSSGTPVYGAQWVGPNGGTGDQRQAVKVNTATGTVGTIPPIRLDRAGSPPLPPRTPGGVAP